MSTKAKADRMRRMVLVMCSTCHIPAADADLVADDLLEGVMNCRSKLVFARLTYRLRVHSARIFGRKLREVPTRYIDLEAANDFDSWLLRYLREDEDSEMRQGPLGLWERNYDAHSRLFAIENGVCPRCSRVGNFTPEGGKCKCGFEY